MFIGFIAVILILLIIVVIMSTGVTTSGSDADYFAHASKVKALISHMKGESQFYYSGNDQSFKDIDVTYFKDVGYDENYIGHDTMLADEWKGLSEDYTGDYLKLGGPAGDNMRIVVYSTDDGQGLVIAIVGKDADGDGEVDDVDPKYPPILEQVMRGDSAFLGS